MVNHEKLIASIRALRHFIDDSLALRREEHQITGFELSEHLLSSAAHNTYVEVVGNKADTLYARAEESLTEMTTFTYLDRIRRLNKSFNWKSKKVILAFDYTDENFYGEVQGLDIYGWKKEGAISGKFKFITCSIVSDEIPEKIPLISLPIRVGHYKSSVILHCLYLIKEYIGEIELLLFDRGFYDKDLMYELIKSDYPFLIFVPKASDKKGILYSLDKEEHIAVIWDYEVNKDKSNYKFEAYLTFLKQIYDKKIDKELDWVFVTNVKEVALSNIIATYKKRWRIETGFRVQDEAKIKCKSRRMKIRYFLFMFEQLLQTQWMCFYKEEVSFKKFLIEIHETCKYWVAHPKRSYGKKSKVTSK